MEATEDTIDICFRMVTEKTFTLRICSTIKVSDLKTLVSGMSEILPEDQRLIFKGQLLKDDRTLDSYSVDSGSTIHVVSRGNRTNAPSTSEEQTLEGSAGGAQSFSRGIASSMGIIVSPIFSATAEIPVVGGQSQFGGTADHASQNTQDQGEQSGTTGPQTTAGNWQWSTYNIDVHPLMVGRMQFSRAVDSRDATNVEQVASQLLNGVVNSLMDAGMSQITVPEYQQTNSGSGGAGVLESPACRSLGNDVRSSIIEARDTLQRVAASLGSSVQSSEESKDPSSANEDGDICQTDGGSVWNARSGASVAVNRQGNLVFVVDPELLDSKLPWHLLERLEATLSSRNLHRNGSGPFVIASEARSRTFCEFVSRFNAASAAASNLLDDVGRWQRREHRLEVPVFAYMASVSALVSSIQAELSMLYSWLFAQMATSVDMRALVDAMRQDGPNDSEVQRPPDVPIQSGGDQIDIDAQALPETVVTASDGMERVEKVESDVSGGSRGFQQLHVYQCAPSFKRRMAEAGAWKTFSSVYNGDEDCNL